MKTLQALGAFIVVLIAHPANAQDWPNRPMTMVAPFAAGGSTDAIARIVADGLSIQLHQPVIVENVGGAGGMTGTNRVAKAAPDGYQFVLGNVGTHAQNQTLYKAPLYNAATDFAPVVLMHGPVAGAGRAQRFSRQQPAGIHRLHEGEPVEDAVQLGGRGRIQSSRLRAAQCGDRHQCHAYSLSRRRAGDAGPLGRPCRLPVPERADRHAADHRQDREGDRDPDQEPVAELCRTCHRRTNKG